MNTLRILGRLAPLLALVLAGCRPSPQLPVPTQDQLAWQRSEMNLFCHFGPNTFSGAEWGDGTEPEDLFCPTELDCRQWARTAKAAGFGGIIVTAKHHDGFCLWPNPESTHTVAQSRWREGRGDVLAELSAACREYGLGFGVYISPWDRHDPHYGTPAYNDVYCRTLESVYDGRYGPIFEHWFDGACGEGPNGKIQEYDWERFTGTIRRLQPHTVQFSDIGPDCRWVGNEAGRAGRTSWSTLSPEGFTPGAGAPPVDTLNCGHRHGTHWIPSETDISIRPGWFWKASETASLKSVEELLRIYYESVGRNSVLLLNVPPDTRGRIDPADSLRLMEWRQALDGIFREDLAADGRLRRRGSTWTLTLPGERRFNRIVLQEDIARGQRIAAFTVEALTAEGWVPLAAETTVGYKRILLVDDTAATALRVCVTDALARPLLSHIGLYLAH